MIEKHLFDIIGHELHGRELDAVKDFKKRIDEFILDEFDILVAAKHERQCAISLAISAVVFDTAYCVYLSGLTPKQLKDDKCKELLNGFTDTLFGANRDIMIELQEKQQSNDK